MISISVKEYPKIIRHLYANSVPMMTYGPPGIGKTEIQFQEAQAEAKKQEKIFIEWGKASKPDKAKAIANADKYFCFIDMRLSQMEMSDIRGIPNLCEGAEGLEVLPWTWTIYATTKGASGVIFLDEINLAPPAIAASAYQMINERVVADRPLSDGIWCAAAGNRTSDKAFTFEMPFPLKDRFAEIELVVDVDAWLDWAMKTSCVNSHIIAFIQWKNSYIYKVDKKGADKAVTPRGLVRASKLIEGRNIIEDPDVYAFVSMSVGEAFTAEWRAYVKNYKTLKWDDIYANPKKALKGMVPDLLFACTGGLVERYQAKVDIDQFNATMKVCLALQADFAVTVLHQMVKTDKQKWRTFSRKSGKIFDQVVSQCGKFLAD